MSEDDEEWRYSLEDLEDDVEAEPAAESPESDGNVAGSFFPDEELVPGDVDLENAVFVVLGAVLSGLVFVWFVVALT